MRRPAYAPAKPLSQVGDTTPKRGGVTLRRLAPPDALPGGVPTQQRPPSPSDPNGTASAATPPRGAGDAIPVIEGRGGAEALAADAPLPPQLCAGPDGGAAILAARVLAVFGEAHASEEYVPKDGVGFTDGVASITVAGSLLSCHSERPATCYTRQWFFGAMGLRAAFRCTPVADGVVGVGILPHHQRPASGEHLLGTGGFPGSVGCLVLGGDVWVMSGGRVLDKRAVSAGSAASSVDVTVVVRAGSVAFDINGARFDVALPAGIEQFRLGASMNRPEQQVRLLSCTFQHEWGPAFTFSNYHSRSVVGLCGPSTASEPPRFQCLESRAATLYSYQRFRSGDSVRLKVQVTTYGSEAVGIGVLYADAINECAFRSLGDAYLEGSVGLLLHRGELIARFRGADYAVPLPLHIELSGRAPVELELGHVEGRVECAVQGVKIALPQQLVSRLSAGGLYRFGITLSEVGQSVEVVRAQRAWSSNEPIDGVPTADSGGPNADSPDRAGCPNPLKADDAAAGHGDGRGAGRGAHRTFASYYAVGSHLGHLGNDRYCSKKTQPEAPARFWSSDYCIPAHDDPLAAWHHEHQKWEVLHIDPACVRGREFIVRLHDAFWDDGVKVPIPVADLRVVMEFVEGMSLADAIREWSDCRSPLGYRLRVAKKWIHQLLLAVQAFEACGLMHNDIRLGSIMLTKAERGRTGDVRIADLGWCESKQYYERMAQAARRNPDYQASDVRNVARIALELVTGLERADANDWSLQEGMAAGAPVRFPAWYRFGAGQGAAGGAVLEDWKLFRDFFFSLGHESINSVPSAAAALKHPWLATAMDADGGCRRTLMKFAPTPPPRGRAWPCCNS